MAKKPSTPLDRIAALIEERGLSEANVSIAAGFNRAYLARRRVAGGDLDDNAIEAYAFALKVLPSSLKGEKAAAAADNLAVLPAGAKGIKTPAAANDSLLVSFEQLQSSKLNPRKTMDPEAIEELAASIEAQGLLQNLVVRPGRDGGFIIIAGHRRHAAIARLCQYAKWDRTAANIPVRVRNVSDGEHLALALLENLMRVDVNPMEEAEAFAALQAIDPKKWAPSQIAKQIGMTARHVQLRLALTRTAPPVQKALKEGKINLAMARTLTMLPPSKQAKYVSGNREFATAEQLRKDITWNMVPTDKAKFDVATCGAKIVTDPDSGKSWFSDRAEFQHLQQKVAKTMLADLKKKWKWAELGSNFFASAYEKEKSEDPKKAGAFIELDYRGEITVYTGLVKANTSRAKQRAEATAREGERTQRHLLGKHLTRDVQRVALRAPRLAHMLGIFGNLTDLAGYYNDNIPKAAIKAVPGLAVISPFVQPGYQGFELIPDADLAALWRAIAGMSDTDLADASAAILAAQASISIRDDADRLAIEALCATAGVTIPTGPLEDIEDEDGDEDEDDDGQTDIEDAAAEAAAE